MSNNSDRSEERMKSAVIYVLAGKARKKPESMPELEMLVAEKLSHDEAANTGVVPTTTGGLSEPDKQLMQKALDELSGSTEGGSGQVIGHAAISSYVANRALNEAQVDAEIEIRSLKAKGVSARAVRERYSPFQLQFLDATIDRVYRPPRSNVAAQPTMEKPGPKTDTEFHRRCMEMAVEAARKSQAEDKRPHPKVGAVVVKQGEILAVSHRGELSEGDHAEFTVLEKKLSKEMLVGATVYATLEPCTTRNHPKVPCAVRLVERKVARVYIGMLDPNPDIRGRGERLLRDANIEVHFFDHDLTQQIGELNRDFIRAQDEGDAIRGRDDNFEKAIPSDIQASRDREDGFKRLQSDFAGRVTQGAFHDYSELPATLLTIQTGVVNELEYDDLNRKVQETGRDVRPDETTMHWSDERHQTVELGTNGLLFHAFGGDYWSFKRAWEFKQMPAARLEHGDAIPSFLPSTDLQMNIVRHAFEQCRLLHALRLPFPWLVGVSIVAAEGFSLVTQSEKSPRTIDTDALHFGPHTIAKPDQIADRSALAGVLRTLLDRLCRRVGWECSECYTETGVWNRRFLA